MSRKNFDILKNWLKNSLSVSNFFEEFEIIGGWFLANFSANLMILNNLNNRFNLQLYDLTSVKGDSVYKTPFKEGICE